MTNCCNSNETATFSVPRNTKCRPRRARRPHWSLVFALAVLCSPGCHLAMRARVDGTGPTPVFYISGPFGSTSRAVAIEVIGHPPNRYSTELQWRIVATNPQGTPVEQLIYSTVPPGFRQTYPAVGPPEPLRSDWSYRLSVAPGPARQWLWGEGGWANAPGGVNFRVPVTQPHSESESAFDPGVWHD